MTGIPVSLIAQARLRHESLFSSWDLLPDIACVLQGYDQDGVDDLVSGVLMGSYHSGGGGGPLIGGACKHGLGIALLASDSVLLSAVLRDYPSGQV